jgi:phosphoglycerate dehydrogenase-like enzyme
MEPIAVAADPRAQRALDRLEAAGRLPAPLRVRLVPLGEDGRADPAAADGVRVLWRRVALSNARLAAAVDSLPDLAWVHTDSVGIDGLPLRRLADRGVVVTNGAGGVARPMAEWVLLAMLAAAKQLPDIVRRSDAGRWDPSPVLAELDGAVALLVGYGSVGRLAATMAAPFGVEVRVAARRPRDPPPAGVSRFVTGPAWRDELPDADYLVLALPLTAETAGMVDAAVLDAMKPTAWLINVARGGLVDEAALVAALDAGKLGGAVLDAFTTEPLPAGHPLWGRPNVLVVPHLTWSSPRAGERLAGLFADQLARWAAGQPLANQVDLGAGY